jgi:hypothetical protein
MMLYCSGWDVLRGRFLEPMMSGIDDFDRLPSKKRVTLLLGGEAGGQRVDHWLPPREAPEDAAVTSGPGYGLCDAFRVAAYLQRVMKLRMAYLGPLRRTHDPLQNQGPDG